MLSKKDSMEELATYMRAGAAIFGFCETPELLIALTHSACDCGPPSGANRKHHGAGERLEPAGALGAIVRRNRNDH